MNSQEFQKVIDTLTEEQKERIKAKCNWEHMSWLGVYTNWPDMFTPIK